MDPKWQFLSTFFFVVLMAAASPAGAKCVTPVLPPLAYERQSWSELEALKTSPPNHPSIRRRQDLHDDGHGALNIDFYSVTLDSNGQDASSLLSEIRRDLNGLIFKGTTYGVAPHDDAQAQRWGASNPTGAIMAFTLARIPSVMDLERGAVFVSCASATDFVFSTLEMAPYGLHPVAGNRAFGVQDHGNRALTFYTMAVDRIVNAGSFGQMPETGRERIFRLGDDVWRGMQRNIAAVYADRNPRDIFVFSRRVAYP